MSPLMLLGLLFSPGRPWLHAQDPANPLPDSPSPQIAQDPPGQSAVQRTETWRSLPTDFLHDQKEIWLFPVQLAKGRDWVPTLAIAGGTIGLLYADPHSMPYFSKHQGQLDDVNDVFDPSIAAGEIAALPVSLLAAGYLRHDSCQVGTALLAADAYGDSAVVDVALKAITRRERPVNVPAGTPFTGTFFSSKESPISGSGFPSGHATAAFSIATVVAMRYRRHRWVPWAVYGFATVVSLSRVSTLAHFPSDVFAGAALGATIARYQTLRPR
ncbi:MAG TPA: phosphatase PAP2 family protein [Acidobacteriaceae bacterium]|nr:phosphatase PAP2 family protein [Acidobacteriaceae bacterium]